MATTSLSEANGLRIAVEGCGHGVLHSIYASVDAACERAGWPGVDLLIIGGDFQAVRNANDLACVSMPAKYWSMQDFHSYYSGERRAPYLTIFVGGNHEASNYLFELHYGGWVAPNIYYLGAANVVRIGPLRIAGMSGIWKGYDYRKSHFERLPYNADDVKSVYHTREVDVRKLLAIRTQVDIGISHDWPKGVEWEGDHSRLFRSKGHLEQDARDGRLGNTAARQVLERLRPRWWFSAHLHVKFAATVEHVKPSNGESSIATPTKETDIGKHTNGIDPQDGTETVPRTMAPGAAANDDEIDLELEDDEGPAEASAVLHGANGAPEPAAEEVQTENTEVSEDVRAQLPEAFTRPKTPPPASLPFPSDISNNQTKFLALDKCLPNRDFLQLLAVPIDGTSAELQRPLKLHYDKEWLAITRVFAADLVVGDVSHQVPRHKGEAHYRPLIEVEEQWVEEHVNKTDGMQVPENFHITAPVYDGQGIGKVEVPREYTNNQTRDYCKLLDIDNPFDMSEDERNSRMRQGPRPAEPRGGSNDRGGGGRGRGPRRGDRGRGGRGRGRGGRGGRW
ncbi:hypothetical protein CAC42_1752 [Sphaceloma murrayae]|uniref:Lariat debranching enzyme C-terminal domain-containing protein n=1 Tax=Sphaceloma murrayae TaxID=2082308 RepID=A0A2K1QIL3_9PEZI|nr:hypothetical protein CAC42_1752 [Sphaceloma murrayae]